ncbi:DUF2846 domain-containing protein [Ramlibacter sp. USB13]|uniref:DUF2846 domain-containing protein n=1 Tax=Ramlibacter cellulosilyticus TaxID=2764187 RepID=A0A923MUD1_9BURK|nr:DUF2846 domain-containing protein [Ramlibacter cellulosilyticus]MBC5785181.1 DUF2846 domain-containing protein [Ramlibacter cellulosilyticus]
MKRQFLKLALAGVALALVSGCATGIKHEQMAASMPSLKAGQGRIYFYRTSSMIGAAIQPDIRLNGQVVGESKPGGFFYVDRPAGNYVATASTETEKAVTFTLQAGETKYIRSSVGLGIIAGRVVLEPENREKALSELNSLSYTGAPVAAR